jgi:hypothetical protein
MPTPNSPSADQTVDIHADPEFRSQFGTNVGNKILETDGVGEVLAATSDGPASIAPEWTDAPVGRRCNVGRAEQKIRLIGGAALLGAAAFAPVGRNWRIAMAAFGAMEIVTGATRYCPVWQALGVNTCRGGSDGS